MEPFAWIGVFIQRRSIELRKTMRVIGKVRGNPVQNHAQVCTMAAVDEGREAFYGMPYDDWRAQHQTEASPAAQEAFKSSHD